MRSLFQCVYMLFSLHFENVTCRMKNEYMHWFEDAFFFSYSFSLTNENAATYHKLVCFEESTSFSCVFDVKGPLHKMCDNFFIYFKSFDV